ncbi:MAG: glycosyltransferase family 39 protein [Bdellovibrionales bacterium]|nr:glycosyltransferase family 39 protein [Bdellovibrionales bacterium]
MRFLFESLNKLDQKIDSYINSKSCFISTACILSLFIFLKWKDLFIPLWDDELVYAPNNLLDLEFSFFLPWNYDSNLFFGHPFLHPLILYITSSLFGFNVFPLKMISLILSFFCLGALYKMTLSLFKDKSIAFFTLLFCSFQDLFFAHSSFVLADILMMGLGFVNIYTFIEKKYKSLMFFSVALATSRESSLGFLLPLFLYAIFNKKQHKKSFFYIIPSLFVFLSHFLISFLKHGHLSTHPYTLGELPHNPHARFFDFSIFFDNSFNFFNWFLTFYPSIWFKLFCFSIILFLYSFIQSKKLNLNIKKEIFIPLGMIFLFYMFWILWPDQLERNFFPIFIFFISIGNAFIIKYLPFSKILILLAFIFSFFSKFDFSKSKNLNELKLSFDKKTFKNKSFESFNYYQFQQVIFLISYLNKNYLDKNYFQNKKLLIYWNIYEMTTHKTYKKERLKSKQISKHYGYYTDVKNEKVNLSTPPHHEFNIIVFKIDDHEFEDFLKKDSFFVQVEVPQLEIYKLFVKKEI